jgi:hypothetical protein
MTRSLWLVALLVLVGPEAGCRAPDFTERRALDGPAMTFRDEPTRAHFRAKAHDAREGGAGDFGSGAGGGCGCY